MHLQQHLLCSAGICPLDQIAFDAMKAEELDQERLSKKTKGPSETPLSTSSELNYPEEISKTISQHQKEALWRELRAVRLELQELQSRLAQKEHLVWHFVKRQKTFEEKLATLDKSDLNRLSAQYGSIFGELVVLHQDQTVDLESLENSDDQISLFLKEKNEIIRKLDSEVSLLRRKVIRLELDLVRFKNGQGGEQKPTNNLESPTSNSPDTEAIHSIAQKRLEAMEDLQQQNLKLSQRLYDAEAKENIHEFLELSEANKKLKEEMHRMEGSLSSLHTKIEETSRFCSRYISEAADNDRYLKNLGQNLVETIEKECLRLRRDRDEMRVMYESANSQVQSLNYQKTELENTMASLKSSEELFAAIQAKLDQVGSASEGSDQVKADLQSFFTELEGLSLVMDELSAKLQTANKLLSQKDDSINNAISEKLKSEFNVSLIRKEMELSNHKAQILEKQAIESLRLSAEQKTKYFEELSTSKSQLDLLLIEREKTHKRISLLLEENQILKSYKKESSDLKKELAEKNHQNYELTQSSNLLKQENAVFHEKFNKLKESGNKFFAQDLQEELEMYRKIMKCNSCHIRDKDSVIMKCMHVFCRNCLDTRIETRQRKCPNCGESFGVNDIKTIFL